MQRRQLGRFVQAFGPFFWCIRYSSRLTTFPPYSVAPQARCHVHHHTAFLQVGPQTLDPFCQPQHIHTDMIPQTFTSNIECSFFRGAVDANIVYQTVDLAYLPDGSADGFSEALNGGKRGGVRQERRCCTREYGSWYRRRTGWNRGRRGRLWDCGHWRKLFLRRKRRAAGRTRGPGRGSSE